MQILIMDRDPSRLAAWHKHMGRPGRTCHLAKSTEEARNLLMSDPFDLVILEPGAAAELTGVAALHNPRCQVVDLPSRRDDIARQQQPNPQKWRRMGMVGDTKAVQAKQDGPVKWRAFRRIGTWHVTDAQLTATDRPVSQPDRWRSGAVAPPQSMADETPRARVSA